MEFHLPELGAAAIPLPHFPTRQQAFIFRAFEFVKPERIAKILETSAENVLRAAEDMGLKKPCDSDIWLKKGYITIIRSLWHILPYDQLMDLLDMDRDTFAKLLREEDFLDVKLGKKPVCEPLVWQELTREQQKQTEMLRQAMADVTIDGAAPFDFAYSAPKMEFSGKPLFGNRMIYGFSSLYQTALDVDSEEYCPDSMLQAYGNLGINALWIPVALHDISEFPFDKKLSEGYEVRLARLRHFSERCDTFGLKLFIYLNEPRSLPEEFYVNYPELKGHRRDAGQVCLCTSTKEVQDYLTNNVAFVCRNVPKLGGIFTITRSENTTNCYSHSGTGRTNHPLCNCPRCSQRTPGEVIGQVAACYEKGVHSVDPNMKVIVWSWSWGEDNLDIIANLPDNVILQSNSEDLKEFIIGGVSGNVRDYSMSIVGPGEKAKAEWRAAKARGLETAAKVQINTTWECSTVPAVPVYPLIEEHMQNLREEGVDHIMLSWTLGGYPSRNIQYAAKYFYEGCLTPPAETERQKKATSLFSQAFRQFPFDIGVLYQGPQNGGVSNLLFTEPTGYTATMTCYAYDDLTSWRSIYPEDVFEDQLGGLCKTWAEGLALLEDDGSELYIMAKAAYIQFSACLNQVRFYRARSTGDSATMKQMAEKELQNAQEMLALMNRTPVLGFEAANHYYFSKGNIAEKIVNCKDIIKETAMNTILIRNQKTDYAIVIPRAAAPVEETAAEELQQYLRKALGAELPICKEGELTGKGFYIGHTDYTKAAGILGKSEENWIIQLHEDNVILTGGVKENDRGILYAVYHFLEDIVGIRWWSVWEEYVPELTELSLEAGFCKEGTPFFEHRKVLGFRQMEDFYYDARTRGNVVGDDGLADGVYHPSIKKLGGAKPFGRPHHVHTIDKYFPPEEYFDKHPEWFALYNGQRVPWSHFCLTNEILCDTLTERLLAYIEEDKALSAETGASLPDYYDISFPDQMEGFCQCDACRAAVASSGISGYALHFVNKVARVVAKKHPDVTLETLAYGVYAEPPKDDTLPEKNVMIRLANVYMDIIHKFRDKGNLQGNRLLRQWSEICKKSGSKFQIWDYTFNIMADMPLPVVARLGDSFRTYADCGVSGMFIENERPSTDMWDLLQYVLVHLCEDPYADTDALIGDFITRYYGPAAEYMGAYLQELFRCAEEHQNVSVFCNVESAQFSYLDYKAVKNGMILLDKAAAAVAEDPVLGPRVRYVRTLLGGALLTKYFDLKRNAEAVGETFDYDREAIRQMVVAGFQEAQKHPRVSENAPAQKIAEQIKFYSGLVFADEPDTAPLPPELSGVAPEDVYQFFYKNSCRYFVYADLYGASFVEDPDSSLGKVVKLCREEAIYPSEVANLIATSREAVHPRSVKFRVMKDWKYVDSVELFREDIVPDKYHLYKVGSASGIRDAGNVRVDIFGNNYEWLQLSGIAEVFPMDACDVYLSVKFAGEPYGGSCEQQEAVYLDRAIIVRRHR